MFQSAAVSLKFFREWSIYDLNDNAWLYMYWRVFWLRLLCLITIFCVLYRSKQDAYLEVDKKDIVEGSSPGSYTNLNTDSTVYLGQFNCIINILNISSGFLWCIIKFFFTFSLKIVFNIFGIFIVHPLITLQINGETPIHCLATYLINKQQAFTWILGLHVHNI